ncbi:hypothetical protein DID88_004553 [Monilinia fructigena]|uniref:Polyketide synthase dehydratase domain-containing protein n=1 Tax=Monilinia fructigena TaxID=38457 RepID=A0A395IQY5_9HELO|nr:hypothetical protein DID88_004553 [Monilinia fructigena]
MSMNPWYKKLAEGGLFFGPQFQSLTSLSTDGSRIRSDALSTTNLKKKVGKDYQILSILCIQLLLMLACGNLSTLKAFLPVFISECRIQSLGETNDEEATISYQNDHNCFATRRIDATLLGPSGSVVIDMKDVRLSLYTGKMGSGETNDDIHSERHPTLRVNWRPDILSLIWQPDLVDNETQAVIGALLDLIGHHNPRMRVLELGPDCDCRPKSWLSLLHKETALPRIQSWNTGSLAENGDLTVSNGASGPFDTLLISKLSESQKLWKHTPEKLISLVGQNGVVVTRKTDSALSSLAAAKFSIVEIRKQIILAVRTPVSKSLLGKDVLIITANKPSSAVAKFSKSLSTYLKQTAGAAQVNDVPIANLNQVSITSKTTDALKCLSRALMLEQPSLRFTVYDVGPVGLLNTTSTFSYIERILTVYEDCDDKEFIQAHGLLYTSRFGPDFGINAEFRRQIGEQDPIENTALSTVGPAKLSIGKPGVTDSLHFKQIREPSTTPPAGFIDVAIKAGSGYWHQIISAQQKRVPAWAAQKMLQEEEDSVLCTIPIAYSTAIYALLDRGNLRAGESVLIHSGAGAVGTAAITLAMRIGATVYTTTSSQVKRDY